MSNQALTDLIAAALYAAIAKAAPSGSVSVEDMTASVLPVVEQHITGRHEWPKTTPTGFTYERPTNYANLERMIGHMVQSEIEGWDEAERPPEPVWEMVGIAQQEVRRLSRKMAELEEKYGHLFGRNEHLASRLRVRIEDAREAKARAKRAEAVIAKVEETTMLDGKPRFGAIPVSAIREALKPSDDE